MGGLISSFTVGRNALKRDIDQSARAAMRSIKLVREGVDLSNLKSTDNGAYNVIRDLISFTGIIRRDGNHGSVTPVGGVFERLFQQNPEDAWRWLLTRTLWLYTVPNGTQSAVNKVATDGSFEFDFFRRFLGLLVALSSLPGDARFVSFEELCRLLNDDASWVEQPPALLTKIIAQRASDPSVALSTRSFLDDLEPEYSIPRDNFAALIGKAFSQTGLFEYRRLGVKTTAIALAKQLDSVLQGRVRFVIDHPQTWSGSDWDSHLGLRQVDLPEEVSLQANEGEAIPEAPEELAGLVAAAVADIKLAGLSFDDNLIIRFVSSMLAKRFVLLTGLSGSGKTKLAQAFAMWLPPRWTSPRARFITGDVLKSDRVDYRVTAADELSVEFESGEEGARVSLPYGLIDEWVEAIQEHGYDRKTPARTIRDAVTASSAYSSQLSSFETHLKAAAIATLERSSRTSATRHYEIVSVGPDWTSRDSSLGYVDALNEGKFVRSTPIIDLVLRAHATTTEPFFLVLDEMNLSHVERYFADFLSAAESGEEMFVHGNSSPVDGVPPTMPWPDNLFVLGTVNVDETTYMFSPKVLDRANTIEFRVTPEDIQKHLADAADSVSLSALEGRGARFAASFVAAAKVSSGPIPDWQVLSVEMYLLFAVLYDWGAEFGFRTAKEVARFFRAYALLDPANKDPYRPLDAQVLQKLLPRMSGSRRRLEGILCAIAVFSSHQRQWAEGTGDLINRPIILEQSRKAAQLTDPALHPLSPTYAFTGPPLLPGTYDKVRRMLLRLDAEGFVSFAEA